MATTVIRKKAAEKIAAMVKTARDSVAARVGGELDARRQADHSERKRESPRNS